MKIRFTKHALDKFKVLRNLGWSLTQKQVKQAISKPRWRGTSRFGQPTAMSLLDDRHILRVVFEKEDDIIRVITVHIARRGTYETTKD